MFGGPPNLAPTSLYYASIFMIYAISSYPKITIPYYTPGSSGNIKAWGFESTYIHRYLIINKDTNVSLNGKVNIITKANKGTKMKCIYLQASSLTSKADNMTLAGHQYIGLNSTPQGTYKQFYYDYNPDLKGYSVDIKYAQAAIC